MPVATVFRNLEQGTSIKEIIEPFDFTHEQIQTLLASATLHSDQSAVSTRLRAR